MNPRLLLATALLASLSACSSSPVAPQDRTQVAPDYVYRLDLLKQDSSSAQPVTITRDAGLKGSGSRVIVYINGQKVVSLAPKETVKLYLEPDTYLFGVVYYSPSSPNAPVERQFTVEAGQPLSVRALVGMGGTLDLQQTSGTP